MKIIGKCFMLFLLWCLFSSTFIMAADKGTYGTEPVLRNGQKWRIGYYEGGEYINYQNVLLATVKELMDMGWIAKADIPPQEGEQTEELWNWLATEVKSDYLEFVADAHYNTNWDRELRKTLQQRLSSVSIRKKILI